MGLSTIVMYDFHYDAICPENGSLAKVAHTDADSFVYRMQTPDLCKEIAENLDAYVTSDYPVDHLIRR